MRFFEPVLSEFCISLKKIIICLGLIIERAYKGGDIVVKSELTAIIIVIKPLHRLTEAIFRGNK